MLAMSAQAEGLEIDPGAMDWMEFPGVSSSTYLLLQANNLHLPF